MLRAYIKSGWIESLSNGAYILKNDTVNWEGAVYALQKSMNNKLHIGGKTALELQGFAHYLKQEIRQIELFSTSSERLPVWFKKQKWINQIQLFTTSVFDYESPGVFRDLSVSNIQLKVAAPELAILEMIYLVPQHHTLNETNLIMASLTTLRPNLIQSQLEKCRSVKVKRLFLYLVEANSHKWFEKLNVKKIYLGSGKREIVKNGKFDKKYNITGLSENEG